MKFLWLLLAAALAPLASAQRYGDRFSDASPTNNPEAYWNRGFACSQSAESYNVSLRVDDVDEAATKIDSLMIAAGGTTTSGNTYYNGGQDGAQVRNRQMTYTVPSKNAERTAKRLMDAGELVNYSLNRQNNGDTLRQINERIKVLEDELKSGADALKSMPAATYFLRSRLSSLRQSQAACGQGTAKSGISIMLQGKPAPRP
jgi:hypothetical protein